MTIYFDHWNVTDFFLSIAAMNTICIFRVTHSGSAAVGEHLLHIKASTQKDVAYRLRTTGQSGYSSECTTATDHEPACLHYIMRVQWTTGIKTWNNSVTCEGANDTVSEGYLASNSTLHNPSG